MRLIDGVRFADNLDELTEAEKRQVPRIVADVKEDYIQRAPDSFIDDEHNRGLLEVWAQTCAELQAVDSINTQRFLRVKGVETLAQLQESGHFSELLLTSKLPPAPWGE